MRAKEIGLWTALITPFTEDGRTVDFSVLGALLKRQEAAHNGILILGSTGEALSLTEDEKREIVRFSCAQKLNVPLMVGVPNLNLAQSLDWLAFCQGFNIDAYLCATPAYTKPAAEGQIEWFSQILNAADAPVMLYNVPSRTGASLSPLVVKSLQKHGHFWAIKESSGGLEAYIDYKTAAPHVQIYCGDDNLLPSTAPLGACGLVSVASNMWPEATALYVKACQEGWYKGQEWWVASKALFVTTSPVPLKALMHAKGYVTSHKVRLPLSHADLPNLDALKAADQIVTSWYQQLMSAKGEKAA